MKRVLVIGCGGSGKSTFSIALSRLTGLPVFHLDQYFWKPNWVEASREEWFGACRELIKADNWILDGNYGSTMEMRMERADTIIFLSMPTWLCVFRIIKRRIQYHGRTRPSITDNCPDRITWEFLHYVMRYRITRRPKILKLMAEQASQKTTVVLNTPKEVRQYLESLTS